MSLNPFKRLKEKRAAEEESQAPQRPQKVYSYVPKKPTSERYLKMYLTEAISGSAQDYDSVCAAMGNAIIASLLDNAIVVGDNAMQMRFKRNTVRHPEPLEIMTSDVDAFVDALAMKLLLGWEGFTGRIIERSSNQAAGQEGDELVMEYDVQLSYVRLPWVIVPIKVTQKADALPAAPDMVQPRDFESLFTCVALPVPGPVPLMPMSYADAQNVPTRIMPPRVTSVQ